MSRRAFGAQMVVRLVMAVLLTFFLHASAAEADPMAGFVARMEQRLVTLTADMPKYRVRVDKECRRLPEGDLFPFCFPLYVAVHHQLAGGTEPLFPQAVGRDLLAATLAAAARRAKAPAGDLTKLRDYRLHATYLGHAALATRAYRHVYADASVIATERHVVDLLAAAIIRQAQMNGGAPISSFPTYSWTFDTVPCLVAMLAGASNLPLAQRRKAVAAHLAWVDRATALQQRKTNVPLPPSQAKRDGKPTAPPRGCELSWRIALLRAIDQDAAKAMWQAYKDHFSVTSGPLFGFREWPAGVHKGQDADSGPVVDDIGATATTFAIAAARSQGDHGVLGRIMLQVAAAEMAMKAGIPIGGVMLKDQVKAFGPYDPDSIAGFLFADVTLAYAVSWQDWTPLIAK